MVYDDNFDHITPLDCAILSENEALILYLKQQGAFTGLEIKHLAACKIQFSFQLYLDSKLEHLSQAIDLRKGLK